MSSCPRSMASSRSWRVTSSQRQTSVLGIYSSRSLTSVFAAGVAGLEEGDLREGRKLRLHLIPDPLGQDLARRVLEAGDLVQVPVIELVVEGLPQLVEVAEVDEPAGVRVDGTGDRELDLEGMAVKPRALVPLGDVGE